jgi:hypothetical protein
MVDSGHVGSEQLAWSGRDWRMPVWLWVGLATMFVSALHIIIDFGVGLFDLHGTLTLTEAATLVGVALIQPRPRWQHRVRHPARVGRHLVAVARPDEGRLQRHQDRIGIMCAQRRPSSIGRLLTLCVLRFPFRVLGCCLLVGLLQGTRLRRLPRGDHVDLPKMIYGKPLF